MSNMIADEFKNKQEFLNWVKNNTKQLVSKFLSDSLNANTFMPGLSRADAEALAQNNLQALRNYIENYEDVRTLFSRLNTNISQGITIIAELNGGKDRVGKTVNYLSKIMSESEFKSLITPDNGILPSSVIKAITEPKKEGNSFLIEYKDGLYNPAPIDLSMRHMDSNVQVLNHDSDSDIQVLSPQQPTDNIYARTGYEGGRFPLNSETIAQDNLKLHNQAGAGGSGSSSQTRVATGIENQLPREGTVITDNFSPIDFSGIATPAISPMDINSFDAALRNLFSPRLTSPLQQYDGANVFLDYANHPVDIQYFRNIAGREPEEVVSMLTQSNINMEMHATILRRSISFLNQESLLQEDLHEIDEDQNSDLIEEFEVTSNEDFEELINLQGVLRGLNLEEREALLNSLSGVLAQSIGYVSELNVAQLNAYGASISSDIQLMEEEEISGNDLRCKRAFGSLCSRAVAEGEASSIALEDLVDIAMIPITIVLDKQIADYQAISNGLQRYYYREVNKAHKLAEVVYNSTKINGLDQLKTSIEKSQDNVRKLLSSVEVAMDKIHEISQARKILHLYKNSDISKDNALVIPIPIIK